MGTMLRRLFAGLALVGLLVMGVMLGRVVRGDPVFAPDDSTVREESVRVEGTSTAPDGGPPWALTVFESENGLACARPGRWVEGQVGDFDSRNRFRAHSAGRRGACFNLKRLPAKDFTWMPFNVNGREIVFGFLADEVTRVEIITPGRRQTVRPTRSRAFVAALPGEPAPSFLRLRFSDGTASERFPLHLRRPRPGRDREPRAPQP
jgi:hypothetical protein